MTSLPDSSGPVAPGWLGARFPVLTTGPMSGLLRPFWRHLPLIALGGLVVSALEGLGLGLLLPLLTVLTDTALPAATPRPLAEAFALVSGEGKTAQILVLGGIILALIGLSGVVQILNTGHIARVEGRLTMDLRNALAAKVSRTDYSVLAGQDSARIVKIMTAESWQLAYMVNTLAVIVTSVSFCLIFSVFLLYLDWRMFLVVAAGVVLIRLLLHRMDRTARELGKAYTEANSRYTERSMTLVRSARPMRVFGATVAELDGFEAAADRLRRHRVGMTRLLVSQRPILEFLFAVLFLGLLVFAEATSVSFVALPVFLLMLYRMQPQLRSISASWLYISSMSSTFGEIAWLLGLPEEKDAVPLAARLPERESTVRFESVGLVYPNGLRALDDVSFELPPGSITALVGPSGAGKSTVVSLLCRLLDAQEGRITWGGRAGETVSLADWRERIAVAGQDLGLVSGSAARNIAYGRPAAALEEIMEVAKIADADQFIRELPDGYNTELGPEGVCLSGGQRQRISIARALLKKPELLILDEATNAVDLASEFTVMRLLAARSHFSTALVISHRPSTLALCDRVVRLEGGKVVEAGTFHGLDAQRGLPERFGLVV